MMINLIAKISATCLFTICIPFLSGAQQKHVELRIVQDNSILLEKYETAVVLQKKPFKIQVLLENVSGIYAFAAFSDSLCCRLSELDTIQDFINLPNRTMAEADYNKEKELLVNDDNSCAYWYYDRDLTWKGFNKKVYALDANKIVAVKSIKQLYYFPEKKEVKLKDVRQPLYLFFVAINEFDANGRPLKELIRKKVRIDWIDEIDD
jgi:hypothetical protein